MSPLKHSNNFAARMGRWSASHWKTAVFGWLAFVVASRSSSATRSAPSTSTTDRRERRRGRARPTRSSRPASRSHDDEQGEIVLDPVEDPDGRRSGLQGRDRRTSPSTLDAFPQVAKLDSPLDAGPRRPRSRRTATRRWSQFSPKGTYDEAIALHRHDRHRRRQDRRRATRASTSRSSAASRTEQGVDEAFNGMLKTAGMIALPLDARRSCCSSSAPPSRRSSRCCSRSRPSSRRRPDRAPEPVHPGRRADRRGRSS